MSLKGKVAIVTGSTSGIGLGIATAFAEAGANVVINGLGTADDNAEAIESVRRHGTKVVFNPANMLRHDEIAGMVAETEREFGSVDVLVNNAGIQHVAPVDEFPVEKWDAILAINLSSSFHSMKAAIPGMKARNFGSADQRLFGPFAARFAEQGRLRRGQAWPRRPDQGCRVGAGHDRHHLQCDFAGLRVDTAGREAGARGCGGARLDGRRGQGLDPGTATERQVRDGRADRGPCDVSGR